MKSDFSMDRSLVFGDNRPFTASRAESPDRLSLRSDFPMYEPICFRNEPRRSYKKRSMPQPVPEGMPLDWTYDHKLCMVRRCEHVTEGTDEPGSRTHLNKIYTELYITEGQSGDTNTEHEVRQLEMMSNKTQDAKIRCSDIFKALPGQQKHTRVVLTNGIAGVGKTFSVLKFTLDWAKNVENQDMSLVIPLSFRELNLVKEEQYSLLKLLHVFHPSLEKLTAEQITACEPVFVFDGLDESRFSLDFDSCEFVSDMTQETSVNVLLVNLIQGNLLPTALIWITSRPAAANRIPSSCVDRVTEVRGFTDEQKDKYFKKRYDMEIPSYAAILKKLPKLTESQRHKKLTKYYTKKRQNEKWGKRIISHVKICRSLHIMCQIPVFCWITATVLEHMLSTNQRDELPKTITDLYSHFLLVQTKKKKKKYGKGRKTEELTREDQNVLLGLGRLAFEELEKGNIMFYHEDLKQCGLGFMNALVFSGVCTEIFKEESVMFQKSVYSFVHLSVQEFLAAVYIDHCYTNSNIQVLEEFLGGWDHDSTLDVFLRRVMEKSLKSENGQLDLLVRFLHGFCLMSNQRLLSGLLGHKEITSQTVMKIIDNLKQMITTDVSPDRSINIFHCLQEMNDQTLHLEIQQFLKSENKSETKLTDIQCSALAYMLQMSEKVIDEFDLKTYNASREGQQRLIPAIRNCTKAVLADCGLTERHLEVVASALKFGHCCLKELDLSSNVLWDSQMDVLCEGLRSRTCRLETLRLNGCLLSKSSFDSLTSALKSNPFHLRELDLSNNNLQSLDLQNLCEFLESPDCQLRILGLCLCKLSESSCLSLMSALKANPNHLEELDLRNNDVWTSSVQHFVDDLMDSPRCKLRTLRLR